MVALLTLASACGKKSGSNSSTSGGNAFGAKESSTIAAEVPSSVKSKGSVTVAVDASYAPNEFFASDNKTIEGWDIDLGHALGVVMGVDFKFEEAGFDGIIPGLASGKYDIGMSSFTDNKEREQTVDMVTYFSAGTSFYVNTNGGPDIGSLDDLCGHSVAVEKGTTQLDDATAQSKTCTDAGKPAVSVSAFPDQNGANLALSSGRAQLGFADSPPAEYQVKKSNGTFKLVGTSIANAPYGLAVSKTGGLAKPLLAALQELMKNGQYMAILTHWGIQAGAISNPKINGAIS